MTKDAILVAAQAAVAKWQSRLHLEPWLITVQVKSLDGESSGSIYVNKRKQTATVNIDAGQPAFYRREHLAWREETDEQLVERTVVHELVHLMHEPWQQLCSAQINWAFGEGKGRGQIGVDAVNAYEDFREAATNPVARVLIEADRSGGWRVGG